MVVFTADPGLAKRFDDELAAVTGGAAHTHIELLAPSFHKSAIPSIEAAFNTWHRRVRSGAIHTVVFDIPALDDIVAGHGPDKDKARTSIHPYGSMHLHPLVTKALSLQNRWFRAAISTAVTATEMAPMSSSVRKSQVMVNHCLTLRQQLLYGRATPLASPTFSP